MKLSWCGTVPKKGLSLFADAVATSPAATTTTRIPTLACILILSEPLYGVRSGPHKCHMR